MKDNMWWGYANKFTAEQWQYINSIQNNQMTIVNAPAGCGKTTIAVMAAKLLGKTLTYVFFPVEEDKMGHRPGTQKEKEQAYLVPLYDALDEMGESPEKAIFSAENMSGKAWIHAISHTFMRGTNLKDTTLIVAESQNGTIPQMKKILTRVHDSTKVIIEGHSGQIDLKNPSQSALVPSIEHFRNKPYANIVTLSKNFRGQLAQDADLL
jgi:phosphate starvation-inducible protein PhoH